MFSYLRISTIFRYCSLETTPFFFSRIKAWFRGCRYLPYESRRVFFCCCSRCTLRIGKEYRYLQDGQPIWSALSYHHHHFDSLSLSPSLPPSLPPSLFLPFLFLPRCSPFSMISDTVVRRVFVRSRGGKPDQYVWPIFLCSLLSYS